MRSILRPHTRFLVIYWPALCLILLFLRGFLAGTEALVPLNNIWQKNRIHLGLEAFRGPAITSYQNGNLVFMLGASEALLGFQPELYDSLSAAQGRKTRAFNFSFQNVGTMLPLYFARVQREMEQSSVRAKVIFVGIPLPRLTKRARDTFFAQARYHDIDAVFFESGLWSALNAPTSDKLILLFNKWVLGERSLVQLHRTVMQLTKLGNISSDIRASADPFYRPEIHPEPAWDPLTRGGYYLNSEKRPDLAAEVIEAARQGEAKKADLQDLIRCCDVLELRLDEDYVAEVIQAVRALRERADHVVLVPFPESPELKRKPAVEERARATMARISSESGAEFWDASSKIRWSSQDYFDHSHFSPEGVRKFNEFLVSATPSSWLSEELGR